MTPLTTSEARAEAMVVVLKIVLPRLLGRREYRRLYRLAREEGRTIGIEDVEDEIASLFELPESAKDMLVRDQNRHGYL